MIAIWVLNQGRSQGRLQVVEKVGGPSQSEIQGGGGESGESDEAKNGGEGEEDTGLWEWQLLLDKQWFDTKSHNEEALCQVIVEEDQREVQDDQDVGVRAIKTKGDLKNEQDVGARGVEVDRRGEKLWQDGESLLSALAFSEIQVPQGWMEGNSAG